MNSETVGTVERERERERETYFKNRRNYLLTSLTPYDYQKNNDFGKTAILKRIANNASKEMATFEKVANIDVEKINSKNSKTDHNRNSLSFMCLKNSSGITLIALVVTIVVLIILATISVNTLLGDSGIITTAEKTKFYAEMSALEERKEMEKLLALLVFTNGNYDDPEFNEEVSLDSGFLERKVTIDELKNFKDTLKAEIIFARNSFGKGDKITTEQVWKKNLYGCQEIFSNEDYLESLTQDIYFISKKTTEKDQMYLYDAVSDMCFKVPQTKIGKYVVHSLPYARFILDGNNSNGVGIIDDDSGIASASDGTKSYEPNLDNFSYKTEVVYYSPDFKQEYLMNIKEFIEEGKPSTKSVDGVTYTFANYVESGSNSTQVWANIKCSANNLVSYWTWIPRYAYKLDAETKTSDIIFVNLNDKPIDTEKYGDNLPEGYIVHEAFKQGDGLKGIWFSKYQPTALETMAIDSTEPETPNLSNFNANDTKLIYYTEDGKGFIEKEFTEAPAQQITENGTTYYFYSYKNKIWANVKCTANGLESWWVWIPRFAYKLEDGESGVILIDENDKPIDTAKYGDSLPAGYKVHAAFKQEGGLKGIWFSKYQPTALETGAVDSTEPETPNLKNFSANDTKLIYYTKDGKDFIEKEFTETPAQEVTENGKTYYFYNYERKLWANVKCTANGLESWWVWIPKYAYKLEGGTAKVILLREDGSPIDTAKYGDSLPEGYKLHEAFRQGDGLKGIWFSKYQPTKQE